MQSADYVPGVSGWKINQHFMEINGHPWGSTRIGDLDAALAERTGSARKYTSANGAVEFDCATGAIKLGPVGVGLEDHASLCIDPGQEVKPLRMGKVTFYGESARQIRAANAVLQSAGAGQLEVVKRANEPGEPFVMIDGQMFISQAAIDDQVRDAPSVKLTVNSQGKYVAAGIGLGVGASVEPVQSDTDWAPGKALEAGAVLECLARKISETKLGRNLEAEIASLQGRLDALDVALADRIGSVVAKALRDELKPGGMLHRG